LKRTPLHQAHVALGARMIEFGGWEMPVWYAGIQAEHQAVRQRVGLFDVCHMGEFIVHDADSTAFLRRVLTNDVLTLDVGQAQYSLLPNAAGGTVDDLLVYRLPAGKKGGEVYLLVVNASNIDKDLSWLRSQVGPAERVKIDDRSADTALIALQGPRAAMVMAEMTGMNVRQMGYYHFARGEVAGVQALVSRTGYTGEDGFEVMTDNKDIAKVWAAALKAGAAQGIEPCGLGARDSLRIEACMPLYGHELDDETSALEAGLGFFVKLDKPAMNGMERLQRERSDGPSRKMVCLELLDRGIPRQGYAILAEGRPVGAVTSGLLSPTLDKAIGMGFVPAAHAALGTELAVDIRGRAVPARVVKRPFYRRAEG